MAQPLRDPPSLPAPGQGRMGRPVSWSRSSWAVLPREVMVGQDPTHFVWEGQIKGCELTLERIPPEFAVAAQELSARIIEVGHWDP
jgi:hypothetical protein